MKNVVAIIIILLCLTGGILFYVKGCSTGHVPDRKPVDGALAAQQAANKATAIKIDSLTKRDAWHKHREDSLVAALKDKGVQLTAKAAAYRDLVARGDAAAARRDTQAIVANADTLRRDAPEGLRVIREYINLTDSAVQDYESRMAIKDSIIVTWADLSRKKDTTISVLQSGYNKVYADDVRKTKFIKLLKPVAAVGIGAVLLDIGIHLLKK